MSMCPTNICILCFGSGKLSAKLHFVKYTLVNSSLFYSYKHANL